ncbi:hypothetical protein FNL37_0541 [Methylovorus glucosotrophus]|nr:hypothetical protein FNL37_0541 [Methylovorus glucosotrophus]
MGCLMVGLTKGTTEPNYHTINSHSRFWRYQAKE